MGLSKRSFGVFHQIFSTFILGLFLILLVLLTLRQANPLSTKLERDSGIYLYVSSSLLKGGLPYMTSWETKPPGIFFIDALALMIGKGTRWGVWGIEFLFLSASVILGYSLLKRQFGLLPALIGTALWLSGLSRVFSGGNLTEEYSLPFGFAALWLWISSENKKNTIKEDIGIGLCTGFAILLRPNNIGVQAAIAITIIFLAIKTDQYKKLLFRFLSIGVATFIPLISAGLFFASRGSFKELIEGSLLYNLFYIKGNLDLRSSLLGGIANLGFAGGIAIFGYFLAVGRMWSQKESPSFDTFLIWIVINGIIEIILSGLSGKTFEHYFICWIPLIATTSAYLVSRVFSDYCSWSETHSTNLTLISLLIYLLLFPNTFQEYTKTFTQLRLQREKSIQRTDPIAVYVDTHTTSEDYVLVWGGQAGINFLAKRNAPTPYIFYPLFESSPFTDDIAKQYYQALQQRPPALIIDGSIFDPEKIVPLDERSPLQWTVEHGVYANPYLSEVLTFIRQNYSLKDVVNNVKIYRHK